MSASLQIIATNERLCLVSEKSAIILPPSSQEVRNGDTAMFQCNAKGTNVSVTWRIDGSICSPENCDLNGITAYQNSNDYQINATLEIAIDLFPAKSVYTLQCIVEQNLISSLLVRNNLVITFSLMVTLQQDATGLSKHSHAHTLI